MASINENQPILSKGESSSPISSKAYVINSVPIIFPYKAYPSQITMMDKIVKGLNKKHNCLLESPTGSGKSLALLCASLSWQRKVNKEISKLEEELDANLNAYGTAVSDSGNEFCPVHCKSISTENLQCNENNLKKVYSNDVSVTSTLPKVVPYVNISTPQSSLGSPCIVKLEKSVESPKSSENISKRTSNFFLDDDFNDFTPLKRYRNSTDSNNLPAMKTDIPSNRNSLKEKLKNDCSELYSPSNYKSYQKQDFDVKNKSISQSCICDKLNKDKIKKEGSSSNLPSKVPTIYFGTRTHKQIEQIIRELKKTIYKDSKMTILSSRERTCVHPDASRADNKNEACDDLVKADGGPACKFYRNSKSISHYNPNRLLSAFDLEDFVKVLKQMRACPYFGSRELLTTADIVFCPYNYLIDPLIRSAMLINLNGSIIIMDEAHNIEDTARTAASGSFTVMALEECSFNLERVGYYNNNKSMTIGGYYLYFADIFKNITKFIKSNVNNLSDYNTFDSSSKVYDGEDMVAILSILKIGPETFSEFRGRFEKILSEETDIEKEEIIDLDKPKLLASSLTVMKNLVQILSYLYKNGLVFVPDYRLVITKYNRVGRRYLADNQMELSLHFWCLNPAVAFSDFKGTIHSLVVTSGTLSPMTSFQSELDIPFQISFEANHVVSKSQMWIGTIGKGPNNTSLNATYKNSATFAFQDDIGILIISICSLVPHGVLCFLPSYNLMEKLIERWEQTGLWDKLTTLKVVVREPRKNQDFQDILDQFYSAIEDSENNIGKGALLFAVCRGKVSEGLDFSDNNARAVITIGIPFPNIKDPQVDLKRKYNDKFATSKKILTGSEWYEIQAFRAINQALGRCIRHRNDFGALIVIDERFQLNNRYQNSLSKWIKRELEHFSSSKDAVSSLALFMDRTGLKVLNQIDEEY